MIFTSPHLFFTDPVLRGPTLGTMLMGLASAIVGVTLFVRKRSLLGETLAHAAYPGVTLAVFLAAFFSAGKGLPIWVMVGAFFSCSLALWLIEKLVIKMRVSCDAALCFTLASFFGIGVTLASIVQFSHGKEYRQIQAYLYGQAATMTEIHIVIYALLFCFIACVIALFYKEMQVMLFDRSFAKGAGLSLALIKSLIHLLVVLAIVIGIRSVGVILMSAMLIGPAIAARAFTQHLSKMFVLAGFFGMLSALLGNLFSLYLSEDFLSGGASVPTGPMIVLVIAVCTLLSLLFAPHRGLVVRFIRIAFFRFERVCENILKTLWRFSPTGEVRLDALEKTQGFSRGYLLFLLVRLRMQGLVQKRRKNVYALTKKGCKKGARIVRLHRLWELYLVQYLGVGVQKVHKNAEEMEHVITPKLEKELTLLLDDPKEDPHRQPIPAQDSIG